MKSHTKLGMLLIACATLPLPALAVGSMNPEYSIREIGVVPGARYSTAYALNDRGQVIGHSLVPPPPPGGSYAGFVQIWKDGVPFQLPAPSATTYGPYMGINSAGHAAFTSGGKPFLFAGSVAWDLNAITANEPAPLDLVNGINDFGEILVKAKMPGSSYIERTFLWKDGKVTDIGSMGGPSTNGRGFNNNAEIVGMTQNASYAYRPFFWRQGKFEDMGLPAGAHPTSPFPSPHGLNHKQVAVGRVYDPSFRSMPVRWWRDPVTQRWSSQMLPNIDGQANGVNDAGVVVGFGSQERVAFVWSAVKGTRRLQDLIQYGTDWQSLTEAWAINASGQIVGNGRRLDGTSRGFILTPR